MSERETERGKTVSLGPFEFGTPDRPCRVVDCGEKADGVVDMGHSSIVAIASAGRGTLFPCSSYATILPFSTWRLMSVMVCLV
jgi:hypothetical protein